MTSWRKDSFPQIIYVSVAVTKCWEIETERGNLPHHSACRWHLCHWKQRQQQTRRPDSGILKVGKHHRIEKNGAITQQQTSGAPGKLSVVSREGLTPSLLPVHDSSRPFPSSGLPSYSLILQESFPSNPPETVNKGNFPYNHGPCQKDTPSPDLKS